MFGYATLKDKAVEVTTILQPDRPPSRTACVLIDMENLFGGYSGTVSGVPIRQILREIDEIMETINIHSMRAVTRAYANWSDGRLASYRLEMMENGVEPVQVFSFSTAVKNAADIELVVDAMSLASEAPWIEVFVIVSGDGGFVPLIRKLHQLGKFVIVIANTRETTNKLLKAVADHFHFVGTQVDPSEGGSDLPPDLPPRADVVRRIRSILKATPGLLSEDGLVLRGAALGQQLRQEIPGFTGAHYGGSLIDLASEAAGRKLQDRGSYYCNHCHFPSHCPQSQKSLKSKILP